ncbi:MAG: ATP phosphoribosyltransferase [Ruminococcus sp.]|jgi:ATP phosphoribosyltransferase regulatory subunit|nr:ATP phosphoribosyltransferase [Ruminococcus sp.]
MKTYDLVTPAGTSDLLPEKVKILREIERGLSALFAENGFLEIMTTELEFMDVFNAKSRHFPPEGLYKAIDDKGRILALRPDSTMPIARLAASRLKAYSELRLFYNQKVFRNSPGGRRRNDELRQMGVEFIGGVDIEKTDLEAAKLALDVFKLLPDSTKCILEIGDIGITKMLLDLLTVDADTKELIRNAIESKNTPELTEILHSVDGAVDIKEAVLKLPRLFGTDSAFDKAFVIIADESIRERLLRLHRFYLELVAANTRENTKITVDLGFANKMDYYTGNVLRGFIENAGEALINGGRYDNLIGEFDPEAAKPATGFAVNMDIFASVFEKKHAPDNTADVLSKLSSQISCVAPEHTLRIALTKGRLEKNAVKLFEDLGFDCTEIHDKGRRLILTVKGTDYSFEAVLAKPNDVITYVESGVCDLGIVGKDTILEDGGKFFELLDLGFGKCRFAVAGKAGQKDKTPIKTVATKYPAVARSYFDALGADIDIVKIEGSVELAPLLKLSDAIVDIVETGSTLVENGLEVYEDIVPLSAWLIANRVSLKMYRDTIKQLIKSIKEKQKEQTS